MRKETYDVFLNKLNSTHWAKAYPDAVLPFDYTKVMFKDSELVDKAFGYFAKTNTTNKVSIYKNVYNHFIAQVASFKKYEEHLKYSKDQSLPSVSIATYINWYEDIIMLNHFDAIGRSHSNNYSCYSDELKPYYVKYFTDNAVEQNGEIFYHSHCPHFHFATAEQTEFNETQEHPNAISIKQLLVYLEDLKNCQDPNSVLLNENFGMPFLTFHTQENKYTYIGILSEVANKILGLSCKANNCEEVIEYMHKIQHLYNINNSTSNLDKIMLDLKILNKLIKKFPNNLELIAIFSNAFVKSVNYKAVETELYKEKV